MRKTYRYKLRPSPTQAQEIEHTLGLCCQLYNCALEHRRTAYQRAGVSITRYSQERELRAIRAELPEYAAVHSHVLQDVLTRLDRTYQAFFRRCTAGAKPGFPRYRSRYRYDSIAYKEWGNGVKIADGRLQLSKIGDIRVRWSRPLEGIVKSVTIRREIDGYYACFSCEAGSRPLPATGREVGIDVGLESYATLSNGEQVENPRHYRMVEGRLKKAQRRLSKCQRGSNRRRKTKTLLAKRHLKVQRSRADFQHKLALDLVRRFDTIHVEKLNVSGMVKNHYLAKSISDAGWRQFLDTLSFKAECAGREVVEVSPAYTSQMCSGCGVIVPKKLSERWHFCSCGASLRRDHNAALNILRAGQAHRGAEAIASALNRESPGL